jgi:hypothetical protein
VGIAVSDSVNFPQTLQFNQTVTATTVTLPNYTTTLAGLSGNQTFTALNTFSAGISASGGVTLAGTLQGTTANFTGLVSSTVGFSGSGTNLTNIVKTINGLSGGVTFAAGTNITLTPVGNTITIASSGGGGGSPVYGVTTSIDFSEQINQIKVRVYGPSVFFGFQPSIFSTADSITDIRLSTDSVSEIITFSNIVSYVASYASDLNAWVVEITAKPPFKFNTTAETIYSSQFFNNLSASWTVGALSFQDSWADGDGGVFDNVELIHKPETFVTKTLTGITWANASSFITCKVMGLTSADHTAEDAIIEGVQFEINNIVGGTGFDIIGHAPEETYGKYTIECLGQ